MSEDIRECHAKYKWLRKRAERRRQKHFPESIFKVKTEEGLLIPFYPGDIVAHHIWIDRNYENSERAIFARLASESTCIFDVGANFGLFTLIAARYSNPQTNIVSIEASNREFQKLQLSLQWNAEYVLKRVEAIQCAATAKDGEVEFYEQLDGYGALNRLDAPAKPNQPHHKITIPGRNLDNLWAEKERPTVDLFKLDVEGHEFPVLEGASNIVEMHRPVFMIEMNDKRVSEQSTPVKVWEHLEGYDYEWYIAENDGSRLTPFEMPQKFGYLNLFAIPKEKKDNILDLASS